MKKIPVSAALLLLAFAAKAQSQDFWNVKIGQATTQETLKTATVQKAEVVKKADNGSIVLNGTFDGQPNTTLKFDFKDNIAYAGYASLASNNDTVLARTAHAYIQKLSEAYGDASEQSGDGDASVAALLRQIENGHVIRFAWRDKETGLVRDIFYKPAAMPHAIVIGCHITDINTWERLGRTN